MECTLKYSILRYSPSLVSGERVNIGVIFSEENLGYHHFYYTKNFSRIKSFSDELDKSVLIDLCEGIKEQVESIHTTPYFNIDNFVKYYVNDFKFEQPHSIVYDDLDKQIEDLKRLYFRFDYEKAQRPSRNDELKFITKILDSTDKKYAKEVRVEGTYGEPITYDVAFDDCYVKLFDYHNKDLSRCINTAKAWAWNCNNEVDKKVYVVYSSDDSSIASNKDYKIISNIFKNSNADFCSLEDFFEKIKTSPN